MPAIAKIVIRETDAAPDKLDKREPHPLFSIIWRALAGRPARFGMIAHQPETRQDIFLIPSRCLRYI